MPDIDNLIVKLNEDVAQAEKLKLEDGDVLVIKADRPITHEHASAIREHGMALLQRLGVRGEVLVLDQGMHAELLKTSHLPKVEAANGYFHQEDGATA